MWVEVALIFVSLWFGLGVPFELFSNEITSYPAMCSNDQKILPWGLARKHYGDIMEVSNRMRDAERNCSIITLNRSTFMINMARGEVYYKNIDYSADIGGVQKLVSCAILSRTDWTCEYPDGSGKIEFIGGLQAIHGSDAALAPEFFYMRRSQWWTARLVRAFGYQSGLYRGPVRSSWLIPEQKGGL
jgi:hypothetical protein